MDSISKPYLSPQTSPSVNAMVTWILQILQSTYSQCWLHTSNDNLGQYLTDVVNALVMIAFRTCGNSSTNIPASVPASYCLHGQRCTYFSLPGRHFCGEINGLSLSRNESLAQEDRVQVLSKQSDTGQTWQRMECITLSWHIWHIVIGKVTVICLFFNDYAMPVFLEGLFYVIWQMQTDNPINVIKADWP